jgi:hypothetical protein
LSGNMTRPQYCCQPYKINPNVAFTFWISFVYRMFIEK